MKPTIQDYMTPAAHTIGLKRSLTDAHRLMREYQIRHLPVLDGGKLVGIVTERDLHLIETLKGVDPDEVLVEEAMSQEAFTVTPETTLADAAREMEKHRYGSAVVTRGGHVIGIFTTIDALRALSELAAPNGKARREAGAPRDIHQ
jgi:acetoin utilization protein AcuB